MAKISQGKVKDKGKTWFPELVDKHTQLYCSTDRYYYVGMKVKKYGQD